MQTKSDKILFDVTDDHLKLVQRLYFQPVFYLDSCTHGLEIWPSVNAKRPLGNTGVLYDVCDTLGWLSPDGGVPENKKTPALLILAQLPVVLECFARNLEIRTGRFEISRYGAWCHYKNTAMLAFWQEALEECSRLGLDAEKAMTFVANTPARGGNPYSLLKEMAGFFSTSEENKKILDVFEYEAIRRYELAHGNPGHDPKAIISMLVSGAAGMSWDGFPF